MWEPCGLHREYNANCAMCDIPTASDMAEEFAAGRAAERAAVIDFLCGMARLTWPGDDQFDRHDRWRGALELAISRIQRGEHLEKPTGAK